MTNFDVDFKKGDSVCGCLSGRRTTMVLAGVPCCPVCGPVVFRVLELLRDDKPVGYLPTFITKLERGELDEVQTVRD